MATVFHNVSANAKTHAAEIHKAITGTSGAEVEKVMIHVLTCHDNAQRREIMDCYNKTYKSQDMITDLKQFMYGNYVHVLEAMLLPPAVYDARTLRKAMKGPGTDEGTLLEILLSRSKEQKLAIKEAYKKEFDRDLEKDVISDSSGHFKDVLVAECQGIREENAVVDWDRAKADADSLFAAGEKWFGTEEDVFTKILSTRSYAQLRGTFDIYKQKYVKDMDHIIKSETSGDTEEGFLAIVDYVRDHHCFFANRLYYSMKGLGTKDSMLIRIIVTRCEIDLNYIKTSFLATHGKRLEEFVKEDCTGEYRRVLEALIN